MKRFDTNLTCPWMSPLPTLSICPFLMMFIVSYPLIVRRAGLKLTQSNPRTLSQRHQQDCFLRAARPEVNSVDWVARGLRADKAERDGDVITTCFGFDRVQGFERDDLRAFDACSGRSAQAQLKLPSIHVRENVRAEIPPDQEDPGGDNHQVSGQRDPTQSPYAMHQVLVFATRLVKVRRFFDRP